VSLLAAVFGAGLMLSVLPWKGAAVIVALAVLGWLALPAVQALAPSVLSLPALLLGWAMGLLIRRTIAERAGV
jgi:hypothetical protein